MRFLPIALLLFAVPMFLVGCGTQDEDTGTPEQDPNENQAEQQSPLSVEVMRFHYDTKCKLLSVKIHFVNFGKLPIFLVADEFCFVTQDPGDNFHALDVEQDANTLTMDLSIIMPTADDIAMMRSRGGYGSYPPMIEIPPDEFRYTTYAFQFPLVFRPHSRPIRTVHAPKRQTKIRLRLGYGYERLVDFTDRELATNLTANAETWYQRVLTDWQHVALTEPITVDFQ